MLIALLEWYRKSELSSDRAGLLGVQDPEVAMRAWANSHPEVAATVREVDAERIQYLVALSVQMGAEPAQAELLARMAYAQLVGIQHLQAFISPADAIHMDHALHAMAFAGAGKPS